MSPNRADRILEEWSAVASTATPPGAPERGAAASRVGSGISLAGAAVLAVALILGAAWLGGREGSVGPGADASPTPDVVVPASPIPASPTPAPSPSPSTKTNPTQSPAPTILACAPTDLVARITQWEGAAGHRIAHVELTNTGSVTCFISTMNRPQLIDGRGAVLIDGNAPSGSDTGKMAAGDVLTTLVEDGNYCGAAPVAPVSVAFILSDGGRVVAEPVSPTDATVPPCNGPGASPTIEMHPWAP
jgi:hypothetical protein